MAYNTKGNKQLIKYGAIAVLVLVAYKFLSSSLKGLGSDVSAGVTSASTGIPRATVIKCQNVADKVHDCMHNYTFETRMNEAIGYLNSLTDSLEVRLTCQLYMNRYSGESMKAIVSSHHYSYLDDAIPDLVSENWF